MLIAQKLCTDQDKTWQLAIFGMDWNGRNQGIIANKTAGPMLRSFSQMSLEVSYYTLMTFDLCFLLFYTCFNYFRDVVLCSGYLIFYVDFVDLRGCLNGLNVKCFRYSSDITLWLNDAIVLAQHLMSTDMPATFLSVEHCFWVPCLFRLLTVLAGWKP